MTELTPTEIAHAWQSHRVLCIELALKMSASNNIDNIINSANKLSIFIMTKSKLEKGAK